METKEYKKRKSKTEKQEKKDKMSSTKKLRKTHEEEDEKVRKEQEEKRTQKEKEIEERVQKELDEYDAQEAREEQARKEREEKEEKEGDERAARELEAKMEHAATKLKTLTGGTVYSNEETLISREGYTIDRTDVAKGHFSKIYKAQKQSEGKECYLKLIVLNNHAKETAQKIRESLKQCQYLKDHEHPNVVKIFDVFSTKDNKCYIFLQPLDGDLKPRLSKAKSNRDQAKKWAQQIGEGLAFLHSCAIAHRNLTPDNVLVDASNTCKISGLSVSAVYYDPEKKERLKMPPSKDYYPHYSPERIKEPYEPSAADVFNYGILIMQMVSGSTPFVLKGSHASPHPITIQWKLCLAVHKVDAGEDLTDLFSKVFEEDPTKRQRMQQVLKHNFFTK